MKHDDRTLYSAAEASAPANPSRRGLLTATVGLVAAESLNGCVIRKPAPAVPPPAPLSPAAPPSNSSSGGKNEGASSREAGPALAKAVDIPSGGGKIFEDQKVVVTCDAGGTLRGFTAVCTHAGCVVASVANGRINCPCHGSQFDASTGARVAGPATAPLKPVGLRQNGDSIYLK
ncbi:QcrA and Rieske domain-containing protein [Streptomyces sp. NPDC002306]